MLAKNRKFFVGSLIIVAAIVFLIISSMNQVTAAYYLPVDQALNGQIEQGNFYRIEGKIDVTNARFDASKDPVELSFQIYDETAPDKKLNVIYYDIKPDNFANATSAVVEGRFRPDGTFQADKLMLKCPTKYDAEV